MPNQNSKYSQYLEIGNASRQINDCAIEANPNLWMDTYPSKSFIDILAKTQQMLSQKKSSLWIEGKPCSGRSRHAYTLKKILESSKEELKSYWTLHKQLKKENVLLDKIISLKKEGAAILVAYPYQAESLNEQKIHYGMDLLISLQESIKAELVKRGLYAGKTTLKESVIACIEDNKQTLKDADWMLSYIRHGDLADSRFNIEQFLELARSLDENRLADKCLQWLTDIIDRNKIKVIFIWEDPLAYIERVDNDVFLAYKKFAEFVGKKDFYFIMVAQDNDYSDYETGLMSLNSANSNANNSIRDELVIDASFIKACNHLPYNIEFNILGSFFKAKTETKADWDICADDLMAKVKISCANIMEAANIEKEESAMKNILPLHPMTALFLLTYMRSDWKRYILEFMPTARDFIKSTLKSFFENTGPLDEHPFLTVDMLWDFFIADCENELIDTKDIKRTFDIYAKKEKLRDDECAVLKTVLIMSLVKNKNGGHFGAEFFKPTQQNINLCFEGIAYLENKTSTILKALKEKGILTVKTAKNGSDSYTPNLPTDSELAFIANFSDYY